MGTIRKTVFVSAVAASLSFGGIATAQAALVSIAVMSVTSGTFAMGVFTPTPIAFTSTTANLVGAYNLATWDVNAVQIGPVAGSIGSFSFGIVYINTFTAAASSQAGVTGGGPTPSGMFDDAGGTSTFDISSFFANWSGTDFNQGNSAASLVTSGCVAGNCSYTMSWTSLIVGGAFNGYTGTWVLNGTIGQRIESIPVPASVWLLGSGLLGLIATARRRRY